jgi:hypothetical protein
MDGVGEMGYRDDDELFHYRVHSLGVLENYILLYAWSGNL